MGNRKILLIAGTLIIVIFIIITFFIIVNRSSKSQSKNFTDYNTSTFSSKYPTDWITDKRIVAGGGQSFTARVNSETEFFPRFTVEATPYSEETMQNKLNVLSFYKLSETKTTFKGYPAVRLAGDLNLHFDTGNPAQKPVYKEFLLVKGKDTLYVISFAYFNDDTKDEAKKKIQSMLDSLQIQ